MKAILRNDFCNLGTMMKSFFIMIIIICGINLWNGNTEFAVAFTGIYCTILTTTTFSFDESTKWSRYAMVMPMKRSDYPKAKFLLLLFLAFAGTFGGTLLALASAFFTHTLTPVMTRELLLVAVTLFSICCVVGAIDIVLLVKFSAEKARFLLLAVVAVSGAIVFLVVQLVSRLFPNTQEEVLVKLLTFTPLLALGIMAMCLFLSIRIFEKKEL